MASKTKVVILGGSVSGCQTARLLAKKHDVTVVSGTDFFEWDIGQTYALTRPGTYMRTVSVEKWKVPGAKHVTGQAVAVKEGWVELASGASLRFDALVVAVGFSAPVVKAGLGQSLTDRQAEVQKVNELVKSARCILIGGGGNMAVELAGDMRDVTDARILLVASSGVCKYLPASAKAKLEAKLAERKIEVLTARVQEPGPVFHRKSFELSNGQTVEADAYIPAFGEANTSFLGELADERGVLVNEFLQSRTRANVFAVGCCSNQMYSNVPQIEEMAKCCAANVTISLASKSSPLKKYTPPPFGTTGPVQQVIGHDSFAYAFRHELPTPLRLGCFACGFPFCPLICCWPLYACGAKPCHPCACGYCCGESEGQGTAKFFSTFAFFFPGGTGAR